MASALRTPVTLFDVLSAREADAAPHLSQAVVLAAYGPPISKQSRAAQAVVLAAVAPPASKQTRDSQLDVLAAYSSGAKNVTARASQLAVLIAYATGDEGQPRSDTWTFVMDGHRFWVLPLGPEGTWAYDTVTRQWCQLNTLGFPGLNFTHGVMWGLRIFGGDVLYPALYEMDPTQPQDEAWRPVQHIVTGGVQTRSPNMIGVANFRLTASAGALSDATTSVDLTFSDDNGNTWSDVFSIPMAQGEFAKPLLWPALGSFSAPGRIFKITDEGGMLSISGADAALNNYDEDESGGGQG